MKKSFEELYNAMAWSRKRCPWAKKRTLKEAAEFLECETKELLQEVRSGKTKRIMDELGDAIAMTMFVAVIAEEKGYFKMKDSLKNAIAKFKRRKPWIFDKRIKVHTVKEAIARYAENKKKEKNKKTKRKK